MLPEVVPGSTATGPGPARRARRGGLATADQWLLRVLGKLFPESPAAAPRSRRFRVWAVVAQALLLIVFVGVQWVRVPGLPVWQVLYWDDYSKFLVWPLQHPWDVVHPIRGYLQTFPLLVGQLATSLPIAYAPKVFAGSAALADAACALFVYHASSGHIRSRTLRALLGLAVVLSPVTPLELIDAALGTPWYMLMALFWAVLWRPRSATGKWAAAILAFITVISQSISILCIVPLAIRAYVLRKPREHAVTAGFLAGLALQIAAVIVAHVTGQSPLNQAYGTGRMVAFWGQNVIGPALGWHLGWWLRDLTGWDTASVIIAAVLVAFFTIIAVRYPRSRAFIVLAVTLGFLITCFTEYVLGYPSGPAVDTIAFEPGGRYTVVPIFLIESAIIVSVECVLRGQATGAHRKKPPESPLPAARETAPAARPRMGTSPRVSRPWVAVAALLAVLLVAWIPDFRYSLTTRGDHNDDTAPWYIVVSDWHRLCQESTTGTIFVRQVDGQPVAQHLKCSAMKF